MTADVARLPISGSGHGLASASPAGLLLRLHFWVRQRKLLITAAVFVVTLLILAPYTYASAGGWQWLSVLVQMLAVWGTLIGARALAVLEVEVAIVSEVERRGSSYLRDLKAGQRTRIDLEQLEETMLPSNPSDPPPAMIRLFQHICKEARDRRFESSVHVMQPYREEPLDDLFKLQNLQKIALWLGILGTFIGLLLAIGAADVDGGDFAGVVKAMFSGLKISFSASLAGLQVAVYLGVLLLIVRRGQESYFKQMEGAVVTMLSLARNSVNKDEYLAEFAQIRETVDALTDTVYGHAQEIKGQTDEIRAGMGRLAEAKSNFDGFLRQIGEAQNAFIADIRSVYDTISLKNLTETLQSTLAQSTRLVGSQLEISSHQIVNRLGDFNGSVESLAKALDLQARVYTETANKLALQISTANNENITVSRAIVTRLQELQARDNSSVSVIRSDLQELSRRVQSLNAAIDRTGHFTPGPRSLRALLAWLVR
jgi:methyl-accepting chemotaxis protein